MDKVVYFFDEYNIFEPRLEEDEIVIALTPRAMYDLDRKNMKYKIPTDYVYPMVVEPVDFEVKSFNLILSETKQTEDYWGRLLDCFKGYNIKYFGNEFKVLRRLVDERDILLTKEMYEVFGGGIG